MARFGSQGGRGGGRSNSQGGGRDGGLRAEGTSSQGGGRGNYQRGERDGGRVNGQDDDWDESRNSNRDEGRDEVQDDAGPLRCSRRGPLLGLTRHARTEIKVRNIGENGLNAVGLKKVTKGTM